MFTVDGLDNEVIKKAIKEIVKHHDILRSVFRNNELIILSIVESKLFDFYEFDYSNEVDKHKAVEEKCNEIQASIDLINGPLVKIAVFELEDTKQMMFCIHHLAVDGVSWRIIAEDFETIVGQINSNKEIALPKKTASFIEWSRLLTEYGKKLSNNVIEYWKNIDAEVGKYCIKSDPSSDYAGKAEIGFDRNVTDILLAKSSNAYDAKINEVLIAALAMAVGKITGQHKLAIRLENHGREELHKPLSIDRTVGWFTNIYPIIVDCDIDERKAIISAKDAVRRVPDSGMGYGFVEHVYTPEICFNYLGDFGGDDNSSNDNKVYSSGNASAEKNIDDIISINGSVSCGKLGFTINSFYNKYGQNFIDNLAEAFKESVIDLANFCNDEKIEDKTVSDLAVSDLNESEVDFLNSLFT